MIRLKKKAVADGLLVESLAAIVLAMALATALILGVILALTTAPFAAAPSTLTPMTHSEPLIAPAGGEDWPVLENPDQENIMVVNLQARPIPSQA